MLPKHVPAAYMTDLAVHWVRALQHLSAWWPWVKHVLNLPGTCALQKCQPALAGCGGWALSSSSSALVQLWQLAGIMWVCAGHAVLAGVCLMLRHA
jgi:hypothetical protein